MEEKPFLLKLSFAEGTDLLLGLQSRIEQAESLLALFPEDSANWVAQKSIVEDLKALELRLKQSIGWST
jgi:hypothetical protein